MTDRQQIVPTRPGRRTPASRQHLLVPRWGSVRFGSSDGSRSTNALTWLSDVRSASGLHFPLPEARRCRGVAVTAACLFKWFPDPGGDPCALVVVGGVCGVFLAALLVLGLDPSDRQF